MYNLLISLGIAAAVYVAVAVAMSPFSAILPAMLVLTIAMFLMARRTTKQVQAELTDLMALLQKQRIDDAKKKIQDISDKYGRWQFLLEGQMAAQLGMLDYVQMKWDLALPQLEKGRFRNWSAEVCIGAIHFRRGRKEKAWESFDKAAGTAKKESIIYLVWATLLSRDGHRDKALEVVNRGLAATPDSAVLKTLLSNIANKRKVKIRALPDMWFQFFPEDMVKKMQGRGQVGVAAGGRMVAPPPRARGKMARRR